jgi:hypothetical protein
LLEFGDGGGSDAGSVPPEAQSPEPRAVQAFCAAPF